VVSLKERPVILGAIVECSGVASVKDDAWTQSEISGGSVTTIGARVKHEVAVVPVCVEVGREMGGTDDVMVVAYFHDTMIGRGNLRV
jgi:hypothetical protein